MRYLTNPKYKPDPTDMVMVFKHIINSFRATAALNYRADDMSSFLLGAFGWAGRSFDVMPGNYGFTHTIDPSSGVITLSHLEVAAWIRHVVGGYLYSTPSGRCLISFGELFIESALVDTLDYFVRQHGPQEKWEKVLTIVKLRARPDLHLEGTSVETVTVSTCPWLHFAGMGSGKNGKRYVSAPPEAFYKRSTSYVLRAEDFSYCITKLSFDGALADHLREGDEPAIPVFADGEVVLEQYGGYARCATWVKIPGGHDVVLSVLVYWPSKHDSGLWFEGVVVAEQDVDVLAKWVDRMKSESESYQEWRTAR